MVRDTRTRHVYAVDEQQHLLGVIRMFTVTELLPPFRLSLLRGQVRTSSGMPMSAIKTMREIMNNQPRSVRADTSLHEPARALIKEKLTELPVIDEANVLTGQANMYEIIKAYLQLRYE